MTIAQRRPRPYFENLPQFDPLHPDNITLRESWWRHRRDGVRLPAERNVILIRGIRL